MRRIYLDYAATTPVDPGVFRAISPYFGEKFGNPGSLHSFGQEAITAADNAREIIAKAIGAEFREVIFTGSATEANNLALRGAIKAAIHSLSRDTGDSFAPAVNDRLRSRRDNPDLSIEDQSYRGSESYRGKVENRFRIITSSIEHESVLETARDLEREGLAKVVYVAPKKNGIVDPRDIEKALDERTVLVSVMYANNEIGTIQSVAEIGKIIKKFRDARNVGSAGDALDVYNKRANASDRTIRTARTIYPLFHVDAVQAFQYLDCDVNELRTDLMTLSAHKIYGPKGIGMLYSRNVLGARNDKVRKISDSNERLKTSDRTIRTLEPIIFGGGQEFGLRSGTENVAGIVGFGKAVELIMKAKSESERVEDLRDYFWEGIKKIYPKAQMNGDLRLRLPNNANIYFPGYKASDLLVHLDLAGIAASFGSACSARSSVPSHVLTACGMSRERVESSLRFSFGRYTTKEEAREAFARIKKILARD